MMVFYIVAALLVIAAWLFIVPPLLGRGPKTAAAARDELNVSVYRDQLSELERDKANDVLAEEPYQQSRREIEQRLLEDVAAPLPGGVPAGLPVARPSRATAIVVALSVPLLAVGLYLWRGTPGAITNSAPIQITGNMSQQQVADQINRMVAQLATKLEQNPNDAEGWAMLARSYFALQRFSDAVTAFDKAVALQPGNAQMYADFADAMAMASGQSLEGQPMELIKQALQIDPNNEKALWLAGTAAYERSDFATALEHWHTLSQLMAPGSEGATVMQQNIAEARSMIEKRDGKKALAALDARLGVKAGAGSSTPAASSGGASVSGMVRVMPQLAGKLAPGDSVFIFAQAPNGPRVPLAVWRGQASQLPVQFTLDESMAMMPQMSLARFDQVIVSARVSKSGNAQPQSGDLEGRTGVVRTGSRDIEVVIDRVVP
ncbi:MAG: c-type cytochrome biogenesis protein CcmI [Gammaproteobacteria bacterium]|nr:c-type cytochrome biogenesis protein CcmI [Gammaproteobacteria bacterium]